jgi:hypothetical protein
MNFKKVVLPARFQRATFRLGVSPRTFTCVISEYHKLRLVGAHIPLSEVGRVLGHTQANTTYRYVNSNVETAKRAAAALDAFNAETRETETVELVH